MTRRRFLLAVKLPAFALMAAPAVQLGIDLLDGTLHGYPYPEVIRETGFWSLRLLLLGLAVMPLRQLTGWNELVRLRRMIGLFAAFYALLHLIRWAARYAFDLRFMASEIVFRTFLLIGFISLLLLVPLAATSTQAAVRRLGGRGWKRLHTLVSGGPGRLRPLCDGGLLAGAEFLAYTLALLLLLGWRLARPFSARGRVRRLA